MSEATRIKIGPWTVSPALNLLEHGTRSIKIEPRTMDVLVFLARNDGAVVSVDELIASVWKGVSVGDSSVYLAIRQLRQALDDAGDGTRFIETIPKRGYRLTVPIERVEPEPGPPQTKAPPPAARRVVAHPIRWLWRLGAAVVGCLILATLVALTLRTRVPPFPESSVAVLRFDDLSADPEQQHFADGLTVELLNALSRVRDLRVTGPASSFHVEDRNRDLPTIDGAPGVTYVLAGSVRKVGDQVRITAQLRHASTGFQQWSKSYDRLFDDILLIQEDIARSVAGAVQITLGVGDLGGMPGMTRDVEAYEEYLRGRAAYRQGRPESSARAIAHLERAVSLDPSFSIAWGELDAIYTNDAMREPSRGEAWRQKGKDALDRARTLTPDAPHVLLGAGVAETRRGQWLKAALLFQRLERSYDHHGMAPHAWSPRGIFLMYVGRVRDAVPALERARAEEPLAPVNALYLSLARTVDRNYPDALAEIDRALELGGVETNLLSTAVIIALNTHDRAEIHKRLGALPKNDSHSLHHRLARFMGATRGAAAEIRHLASTASHAEKPALAFWAAYYQEPALSLELWSDGPRSPDGLWQPLMRDVRKLPAFKDVVRERGLVDYWRAYAWSDFCRPLAGEDFVCS